MGEKTGISWCDSTWNPWQGCTKVSPGCRNCYMFRDKKRWGQDPTQVVLSSNKTFEAPINWLLPIGSRIFVCSWSDFFHIEADKWRRWAWNIIRSLPYNNFLILTKRIERVAKCLPSNWGEGWKNVWLGVSIENQKMADRRIPLLLNIPAQVRFVSCEPLLSYIDISQYLDYAYPKGECRNEQSVERTITSQISRKRGMEDRQVWSDMEPKGEANRTQIAPGLSSSKKDDKRDQDNNRSAQVGLPALQRGNSSGNYNQSQEWNQGRQQAGEFAVGNLFGTSNSFYESFETQSTPLGSMGNAEYDGKTDRFPGGGNSRDIFKGKYNSGEIGKDVRRNISNNIEDSTWREAQEAGRTNGGLYSEEKAREYNTKRERPISFCVVGGESGPDARPMDLNWARSIRDQCRVANVPFWFKQVGGNRKINGVWGGDLLDGKQYHEIPEGA